MDKEPKSFQDEESNEVLLDDILLQSKRRVEKAMSALDDLGISVAERHNVVVPGTLTEQDKSFDLLKESIKESDSVGVYAGINVCSYICKYCRYYSRTGSAEELPDKVDEDLKNLDEEISMVQERINPGVQLESSSLYIGGGTPTLMSEEQMDRFFHSLQRAYKFDESTEITMECTPDTLSVEKVQLMSQYGVNRISMGVQRLDDEWLASMGRKHLTSDVMSGLQLLDESGIRYNIDLLYGFEGQSVQSFVQDLQQILKFSPIEITIYRFEDQKRTDDRQIRLDRAESDQIYLMQDVAREILLQKGYYEGPDGWFTKEGYSKAQVYVDRWQDQKPLIGFGPEAYSFSKYQQHTNLPYHKYLESLGEKELPLDQDRTYEYSQDQQNLRRMIFDLKSTFSTTFNEDHSNFFHSLENAGLGKISDSNFQLNREGILVVEEVMRVLVEESSRLGKE